MNNAKLLIGLLVALLVLSISAGYGFYQKVQKSASPLPSVVNTKQANIQPANSITYTTYSSPKLDFTFEYPNTWKYKETSDNNGTGVGFYETSNMTEAPVLAVNSPMGDNSIDFCSGKRIGRNIIFPYIQLNISPINDSETFVTYEQCDTEPTLKSGAIIYWQKGEKFLSTDDIKDLIKINTMLFGLDDNSRESKDIGLHIAQSIKMK